VNSARRRDPLTQFHAWLAEATRAAEVEPTRMALATVDPSGAPQVRMVLLKQADERGFVFYTNLESPKAVELRAKPTAALCFYWTTTRRQVRVHGAVEDVSDAEADAYFATRARLSQIGAWASRQSSPMSGTYDLERACAVVVRRHGFGPIPRPPFWSGFRVVPTQIEFWTEKAFRRHERVRYSRDAEGWRSERLFP
jgi:pyridoxamine 5'-phosphate oxidase